MVEQRSLENDGTLDGLRLDVAVVRAWPDLSRARVQGLIADGRVRVDGAAAKASARLRRGARVELEIPAAPPTGVIPQELPIAVLLEEPSFLVVDKAAGMVVHPARGSPDSTLVNALAHRLGPGGAGERMGLVHRLDKETSGCLVVARTEAALAALQAQFKGRTVGKRYLALCHGALPAEGRLDTPYGRHPRDRKRFTGRGKGGKRAVTAWTVRERFGDLATLAEVELLTGRTHQIRVHLSEAGHPLLADEGYGGRRREARLPEEHPVRLAAAAVGRQALHAWRLAFDHPVTGRRVEIEAPVPADLERALALLRAASGGGPDVPLSRRRRSPARGRS